MNRACVVVALLVVAVGAAEMSAQQVPLTGVELLNHCGTWLSVDELSRVEGFDIAAAHVVEYVVAARCWGLVRGVTETARRVPGALCAPDTVSFGHAIGVVVRYLNDHPGDLHQRDTTLILRALQDAFPCR